MSQMITDGYLTPIDYAENQQIFVKVEFYDTELSDWADDGNMIAELSGLVTGGNFTFSDNSDMFASGSLTFIVDEIWRPILNVQHLTWWFKGKVKVYKIYRFENGIEEVIPYGVYIVGDNNWTYNSSQYTLSMTLKDCMEALTESYGNTIIGRAGGHDAPDWGFVQFETIKVEAGADIKDTFEKFCELYAPFAFNKSVTSVYDTFPYDIQIDSSSGLHEAFSKFKEPCPACHMYFDLNGMFQFEQIPMRWTEPVHALSNQFFNLVMSEDRKVNADSYRNAVIVWGADVIVPDDAEKTDKQVKTPEKTDEVGKYFAVACDYSDALFEDTKCEVMNFDKLVGNDKCLSMARYELYKKRRISETLTVTLLDRPMPMMYQFKSHVLNVGQKVEYTSIVTGETNMYILREFSNDLKSFTITLTLDRFYEFYPEDEYDEAMHGFPPLGYTYTVDSNTGLLHIDFTGETETALFKVFADNVFHSETCGDSIDVRLDGGQHYIQLFAYNPMKKQKEIGSFSVWVWDYSSGETPIPDHDYGQDWLLCESGEPIITQRGDNLSTKEVNE